jgi:hypothetical protein
MARKARRKGAGRMIDNQAVQAMVSRIKEEIARNPHDSILTFDRIPIQDMSGPAAVFSRRDMKDAAERLMRSYKLIPERDIQSDKPGMKGKVITVLKRAARKSMRFYIEPICEQQSELNHLFACGFRQFTLAFTDIQPDKAKMDDHEDRIVRLEKLVKGRK